MSYGADRDWLLRFCPPEQAAALAALFAIESEVLASLRVGLEHQVAHVRLEWWHEELTRLAESKPRHPATIALAEAAAARALSPPDLRSLIEYVRVDLACVAFLTQTELDEHLRQWSSSIFREATRSHATPDHDSRPGAAEQLATRAGPLVRELELLADFSSHARAGRLYRPLGDPPGPHSRWQQQPLGRDEQDELNARCLAIAAELSAQAQDVEPDLRPALRTPLLWMGFAVTAVHRPQPSSALRRTISSWRDAMAIARGGLPASLRA